jgi:hypothetical protein
MRQGWIGALSALLLVVFSPAARAACAPGDITTVSLTSTALLPYNPFTAFTPKLVTVSVSAVKACAVELAFLSPTLPAAMSGPGTLRYDVQAAGGATSLLYQGGTPVNTVHVEVPSGTSAGTASVQIALAPGQIVAEGAYADAGLTLQVFDRTAGVHTLLKSAGVAVSGSVAKVCQFTAPQSPSLNFSAAISAAMPNPDVVQRVTFTGVSCTAPTVVQLSGGPLQSPDATSPVAGFDNFINYRATAVFNAAVAVLDTRVQSVSTSGTRSSASGALADGSLSVDVNLTRANPLLAGRYQAVLTVTIDPSL